MVEPQSYNDATNQQEPVKKPKKKKLKAAAAAATEEKDDVQSTPSATTITVKVELIHDRPDRMPPVVGYFPSGYNPQNDGDDDGEQSAPPTMNLYKNVQRVKFDDAASAANAPIRKGPEKLELVVTPDGSKKLDFVGTNYRGEASNPQYATYALGILDKDAKTLKIMPIAGNKIFRLDPVFRKRANTANDEDEAATKKPELSAKEKAAKKSQLLDVYSTKKSVAREKKKHNAQFDEESQPDLGNKILQVNQEALTATAIDVARNIPPHNSSATVPKEAYPLDRIIANKDWEVLKDIDAIVEAGGCPVFVRNRIQKLRNVQDDFERETLAGILCYITHLVKYKALQYMDTAASARNHRFPPSWRNKFQEMFNPDGESRRMPGDKQNLLISYVLVLALHFDDFKTDPADIAMDLGVSPVALRQHFEYLGCKFVSDENKVRVATLPVPLRFPEPRRKRNRGQR
ncbi:DNA-directed RNA polymerase I subunit RPA49 [Linum grandiflorum]